MGYWLWGVAAGAAALGILQGVLIGVQTWEHRRFARSRLRNRPSGPSTGRVALVVPCRGMDVGLEENLTRLFEQDYEDYEVWFVVDSCSDPVYAVIGRLMAAHPERRSRLIVAGPAESTGQKVHNLRVATEQVPAGITYLGFVDADARPGPDWLRALVGRLQRPGVGATTGYRWFIPARPSLANHLLYSLNCNIAVLYSGKGPNVLWGGSWLIRRDVFEQAGIRQAWDGTLSDDFVASRALWRSGLHIEFEPACVVASPLDVGLAQMFSFVRRQYLIGRFYIPGAWAVGCALIGFANAVFLGAVAATLWGWLTGVPHPAIPAALCLVLYLLGAGRAWIRNRLALEYFPQWRRPLVAAARFDIWAGPVVNLVNAVALAASMLGRQITWRGITYRLYHGGRIALVRREEGSEAPDPQLPAGEPPPEAADARRQAA